MTTGHKICQTHISSPSFTQSSVGNGTKTLRSKLQDRRVTLSEAIEKENLFLKGSERLADISQDQRTKDQAALQKDFAESKIKTLQAELTKINSSLHAYQAERYQWNLLFMEIVLSFGGAIVSSGSFFSLNFGSMMT